MARRASRPTISVLCGSISIPHTQLQLVVPITMTKADLLPRISSLQQKLLRSGSRSISLARELANLLEAGLSYETIHKLQDSLLRISSQNLNMLRYAT